MHDKNKYQTYTDGITYDANSLKEMFKSLDPTLLDGSGEDTPTKKSEGRGVTKENIKELILTCIQYGHTSERGNSIPSLDEIYNEWKKTL